MNLLGKCARETGVKRVFERERDWELRKIVGDVRREMEMGRGLLERSSFAENSVVVFSLECCEEN